MRAEQTQRQRAAFVRDFIPSLPSKITETLTAMGVELDPVVSENLGHRLASIFTTGDQSLAAIGTEVFARPVVDSLYNAAHQAMGGTRAAWESLVADAPTVDKLAPALVAWAKKEAGNPLDSKRELTDVQIKDHYDKGRPLLAKEVKKLIQAVEEARPEADATRLGAGGRAAGGLTYTTKEEARNLHAQGKLTSLEMKQINASNLPEGYR